MEDTFTCVTSCESYTVSVVSRRTAIAAHLLREHEAQRQLVARSLSIATASTRKLRECRAEARGAERARSQGKYHRVSNDSFSALWPALTPRRWPAHGFGRVLPGQVAKRATWGAPHLHLPCAVAVAMSVSCERCAQPLLVQDDVAELAAGTGDSAEWVLSDARGGSVDPYELGSLEQRMSQLGVASDQAHALTAHMQQINDEKLAGKGTPASPTFFEVLSDSSADAGDAVDHPLCKACTRTALDYMDETAAKLRNEQSLLDAAEAELERQGLLRDAADIPDAELEKMARILNGMDVDLEDLTLQHDELGHRLSSVRAQQAAVDVEIGAARDASKRVQREEDACVSRHAAF